MLKFGNSVGCGSDDGGALMAENKFDAPRRCLAAYLDWLTNGFDESIRFFGGNFVLDGADCYQTIKDTVHLFPKVR